MRGAASAWLIAASVSGKAHAQPRGLFSYLYQFPDMAAMPRRSRVDIQQAARLRAEGLSFRAIGKQLGFTDCGIQGALCRAGLHKVKPSSIINIKRRRFGRLVVLKDSGKRTPSGGVLWLCKCDCGKRKLVWSVALRQGETKSCGCYSRDLMRTLAQRYLLKHGHSRGGQGTRTYSSWASMNSRCRSATSTSWEYYGGRGITVCKRWQGEDGFQNFLADMGERPENHTLDRIDVNGNYTPENCRWATPDVQAANRRCCIADSIEEEFEII